MFLMRHGMQIEDLARQMGITADALSNLIHGRRGFKNETLVKLANTPAFKDGGVTLSQLRAYRAMDEYGFEELILAMVEYVKKGAVEHLSKDFFARFRSTMEQNGFPPALADRKHALLALIQEDPS
ncbi:MAG TPA: helix-turn-helix domain-containing protein [Coleofasciculaceae cyanobacterium]